MKDYIAHVQFNAIEVRVKAKNKREAIKKIRDKVAKKSTRPLIDKNNFWVDEA